MNEHTTRTPRRRRWIIGIVVGSAAGLIAGLLLVVLVAGGLLAPATYLDPWKRTYAADFDDPRMRLVAQAVLAPSSHNEQPWRVVLDEDDDDVFSVYADPSRLTPEVDPFARQTMISQGAFLEYLAIAASAAGSDAVIELFPLGEYDESDLAASMTRLPVATISLRAAGTSTVDFASLFRSDTNRGPYAATSVTAAQARELEGLDAIEGTTLEVLRDEQDVIAIGRAALRGTVIESQNVAVAEESAKLFRSNEYRKNEERSGFAVEGQGTEGFMKYLLQGITTLLPSTNSPASAAERDVALMTNAAAETPAYVIIQTAANSRAQQVEAGMLYARVALRARSLGLVVQPVSQVLEEYPAMRAERDRIHDERAADGGSIQMLLRLGTPTVEYPTTMRRDAADLLDAP